MKITLEVIPHAQQRYNTCGDWQWDVEGNLNIKVSDTGNEYVNFLIGRHEMDEAILCKRYSITEKEVDDYDFAHPEAGGDSFSENMDAPYYQNHCHALAAEWVMANLLAIPWKAYTLLLDNIGWNPKEKSNGDETAS